MDLEDFGHFVSTHKALVIGGGVVLGLVVIWGYLHKSSGSSTAVSTLPPQYLVPAAASVGTTVGPSGSGASSSSGSGSGASSSSGSGSGAGSTHTTTTQTGGSSLAGGSSTPTATTNSTYIAPLKDMYALALSSAKANAHISQAYGYKGESLSANLSAGTPAFDAVVANNLAQALQAASSGANMMTYGGNAGGGGVTYAAYLAQNPGASYASYLNYVPTNP